MANTTFGNLKIKCLRRGGNLYNANDATLLTMMGGIINEVMGEIQSYLKGHPYTLDIGNTVATVASQPYVSLTDTDIIEILQIYQRVSNTKLKQIRYQEYIELIKGNPTLVGGTPEMAWAPSQAVNVSGVNIWSAHLIPTPSSIVTLYYDYVRNLQFSSDGTSADAEFCKLPSVYDYWIIAESKPKILEITDAKNTAAIRKAEESAAQKRAIAMQAIWSQVDQFDQAGTARTQPFVYNRVARTSAP